MPDCMFSCVNLDNSVSPSYNISRTNLFPCLYCTIDITY